MEQENQQEYELWLSEIQSLEDEIMPLLEELSRKMPEIYREYANIVRETVGTALSIIKISPKHSNNIQLAAEIGARTLEAYGAWKAVREHNRLLDKYMGIKHNYAQVNREKINNAHSKAYRILDSSKRRFETYCATQYDLTNENEETIERISNLLLRNLVLYRTHLFLYDVTVYLKAELSAWMRQEQTSVLPRPDYFNVNQQILKQLFGRNTFKALESAGDSLGVLTGAQILLLSDPQFSVFALKDTICKIKYEHTSFPVGILLSKNPGLPYYTSHMEPLIEKMTDVADGLVYFYAFLAFVAVVCLLIWYVPGIWWERVIIGVIASVGIFRITKKSTMNIRIAHVTQTMDHVAQVDERVESYCGKVQTPQVDYTRKNALVSSFKTFFN